MNILHTESSNGWGGQEIRILREAEGLRQRGYGIFFAIAKGGGLVAKAKEKGFTVYEINFKKRNAFFNIFKLLKIIHRHDIHVVNTHSSLDAWLGGIAARLSNKKIVRTRHLSTAIKKGINSRLLYNTLADFVVTTSSSIIPMICSQSRLSPLFCRCIPTGVDPSLLQVQPEKVKKFREYLGVKEEEILVGTACFVRSWKGINDLLRTIQLLQGIKALKWVIVGGGHVSSYKIQAEEMHLSELKFTGHLENPYEAIAAMDIFALLSTANEGISQSSLQAAYLQRPLITTTVGGLPEVCIHEKTGLLVPPFSPEKIAEAVVKLAENPALRTSYGQNAKRLVEEKFTFTETLNGMEAVLKHIL